MFHIVLAYDKQQQQNYDLYIQLFHQYDDLDPIQKKINLMKLREKKYFTWDWIIEFDIVVVELLSNVWPSLSYNTWKIFGIIFGSTRRTSPLD
jgi:hypothetical protein